MKCEYTEDYIYIWAQRKKDTMSCYRVTDFSGVVSTPATDGQSVQNCRGTDVKTSNNVAVLQAQQQNVQRKHTARRLRMIAQAQAQAQRAANLQAAWDRAQARVDAKQAVKPKKHIVRVSVAQAQDWQHPYDNSYVCGCRWHHATLDQHRAAMANMHVRMVRGDM